MWESRGLRGLGVVGGLGVWGVCMVWGLEDVEGLGVRASERSMGCEWNKESGG